jgi:hypothetical protein
LRSTIYDVDNEIEEETMADWALFIGFGWPVRGREQKATEVFGEAMSLWGELQGRGELEGVEAFFLEPHGGDLGGFMLLRGDREKLDRIRASDDFLRVTTRAQLIAESFGVVTAATGGEIERQMGIFLEASRELA